MPAAQGSCTRVANSDHQQCINALNKDLAKVAKIQGKEICKCIKDFAKGKSLPNPTLEACTTADNRQKVAKATAKTINERASRLMANSKVVARVAELRAPAVKKVQRNYGQWLQEVEDVAFVDAKKLEVKTPDKLKALELFGKATGFYQEKAATPQSALEAASTEVLLEMLAEVKARQAARQVPQVNYS